MPRNRKRVRVKADPEFLAAVADALIAYKNSQPKGYRYADLAEALDVDETTVSKYIKRKYPIMGQALARACVDLGISFKYRGRVVSAASFVPAVPILAPLPKQLEFLFDAEYAGEKSQWRHAQRHAEPMEFTLRIKIAG